MPEPAAPFPVLSPVPETLLTLAPGNLPNYRKLRYVGDDLCVSLESLAARDQTLIRNLYGVLTELLYVIADTSSDDSGKWESLGSWSERHDLDRIIDDARVIGLDSYRRAASEELAKAMHDVRGGALSALLGRLQLLAQLPNTTESLNALFVLTRDHLKIMRNAMVGLDDARRDADRKPRAHAMRLMLEKWHASVVGPQSGERSIQMSIDCRYEGTLTECCLESAAIDRIFYNLAANACRYAADERLDMMIFPVAGSSPGDCLRFVLSNALSEENVTRLRALVRANGANDPHGSGPQSLQALFEPEVSSTGSGFGLTVVADFVTSAFGLRDRAQTLSERYVGAVLDGRTFRTWFHWPMAHDDLPTKMDDYHHPRESLSEA